jgi:hypothetical protein
MAFSFRIFDAVETASEKIFTQFSVTYWKFYRLVANFPQHHNVHHPNGNAAWKDREF